MTDHVCAGVCASAPTGETGLVAGRDRASGRFLRGNTASVVSGERSRQFWQAAHQERVAKRLALLRQRGFSSEGDAPPALAAVCDGAAQAILVRDGTFNRLIESGGPTTTNDRPRAVLRAWEAASDRALKHLQAIGLETRERDALDCTITEWAERQEQAEQARGQAQEAHPGPNDTPDGSDIVGE